MTRLHNAFVNGGKLGVLEVQQLQHVQIKYVFVTFIKNTFQHQMQPLGHEFYIETACFCCGKSATDEDSLHQLLLFADADVTNELISSAAIKE